MKKQHWQKALAVTALGTALLTAGVPAFAEAPQSTAAYAVTDAGSTAAAPKPTIITGTTSTENSVTVKWQHRKAEVANGYQVQLAANSSFTQGRLNKMIGKNATISVSFNNLQAGTTYYVRVRTYKTVNGKNVFSAWSQVKTAATAQHTYEDVVTKATLTADGKIVETCTGCGQTGKTTVISHPKTIQLAKNSFVYDGKLKRPAVTVKAADGTVIDAANYTVTYPNNSNAIGKHTCKIVFKGNYQGTVTREFTITPKGTTIESLTASGNSLTVKWAARSKEVVTGYQVQYATDSAFTQNRVGKMIAKPGTTSLKAADLQSGTTYYVRVRTYKTVNGQNVFSGWSAVKTVEISQGNIIASGYCGADGNYQSVSWTLDDKGTLTISGKGDMGDDGTKDGYLGYYSEKILNVIVKKGVTRIGTGAFCNCSNLKSVTIPEGVTSIGKNAFVYCKALTSVVLPEGVTTIEQDAFGCSGLTNVTIPGTVTSIERQAFERCDGLKSVVIPEGVTSIGSSAFSYCSNLSSVTIPDTVTSIGSLAFSGCSMTEITIPGSITVISSDILRGCSNLSSIVLKKGVTTIGENAFASLAKLTNITIPDTVTSIGNSAFSGCSSLAEITLPKSIQLLQKP